MPGAPRAPGRLGDVNARRPAPTLEITFHKVARPTPMAWWEATRRTGGSCRGGYMPIGRGVIPHDLGHLITEARLGLDDGFWGLLARGATFRRGTDRRPTKPGRALIAANRPGLNAAEHAGNAHHFAWMAGEPTPLAPVFDEWAQRWTALPDGGSITLRWPTLELVAPAPARR